MDSWLKRHAVFVTAMSGALYAAGGTARGLAASGSLVRSMVLAVREGWPGTPGTRSRRWPRWVTTCVYSWVIVRHLT